MPLNDVARRLRWGGALWRLLKHCQKCPFWQWVFGEDRKMQNIEYQLIEMEFFKPITPLAMWQCIYIYHCHIAKGGFLPECRAH